MSGLSLEDVKRANDAKDAALQEAQRAKEERDEALRETQRAKEERDEERTTADEMRIKVEEAARLLKETETAHLEVVKTKDDGYLTLFREKDEVREAFLKSDDFLNMLAKQIIPHWQQGVRIVIRQAVAKYNDRDPPIEYFEPNYDDYCGEPDVEDSDEDNAADQENP